MDLSSIKIKKKIFLCLFIFERQRDRAQAGVEWRERGTQNLKQAPGSKLSAQGLTQGSNSQTDRKSVV